MFRRSRPKAMDPELVKLEDSHPKDGLFAQPIVVSDLAPADPEPMDDGQVRVTFRAVVKDAEGRRCPDLNVTATIAGPDRTATGEAVTDLMGAVRFRMAGPHGTYAIELGDVSAGALALDRDASVLTASLDA